MDDAHSYSTQPPAPDFANLARALATQGPSGALFTPEDALQIDVLNSLAGVVLTVSGELLGSRLELVPFSFTISPASNRTVTTTRVSTGSGWLQSVRIQVTTGAPTHGQTFAWIRKCRGTTANALVLGTFQSGYVTANTDMGFPGSSSLGPLDGQGAIRSITGTTPAAGAEIAETVPTGARWELLLFRATLATAVAVATRIPELQIDDGVNLLWQTGQLANQAASLTEKYIYFPGGFTPVLDNSNNVLHALPIGLKMLAGFRIRSLTFAIQAADQWSLVQYLVREWLEGN